MLLKQGADLNENVCAVVGCTEPATVAYGPGVVLPGVQIGFCDPHNCEHTGDVPAPATPAPAPKRGRGRPKKKPAVDPAVAAAVAPPPVEGVPPATEPVAPVPAPVAPAPTVVATKEDPPLETPKMAMVLAFTTEAQKQATDSLELLRQTVVDTPEKEQWILDAARLMAKTKDELVTKRQSWVAPLKKVTSDIEGEFRPIIKLLDEGVDICKSKAGEYRAQLVIKEQKALAEMQQAVQTGNVQQAQAIATTIETTAHAQPEGAKVTMVWTGEVIDANLIPVQFKIPDVVALQAITQSRQCDPQIPGWRAYQVPSVRISRR